MTPRNLILLALCGLFFAATGCNDPAPAKPVAPKGNTKAAPAKTKTAAPAAKGNKAPQKLALDKIAPPAPDTLMPKDGLKGEVLETMNSGGYSYARVKSGTSTFWAAGPESQIKVGDTIAMPQGLPMTNFQSKSLNKTFDKIYFVQGFLINGKPGTNVKVSSKPTSGPASSPASGPASRPGSMPSSMATSQKAPVKIDLNKIAKAEGGITVAELYKNAKSLNGQTVKVRGRAMKSLGGIMNTNWIHLQDGTGDSKQGTHDLTITSPKGVQKGAMIVVEGKVAADKDFGQGYFYKVIVENAVITVEP